MPKEVSWGADIMRQEYTMLALLESDAGLDPFLLFKKWWNEALRSLTPMVDAVTLATSSSMGCPDARIVLLKHFDEQGFVFFTNYESAKSAQIVENPYACLVAWWPQQERQVRIQGSVEKTSQEESDAYFASRPRGAKISAIASSQSYIIEDREALEKRMQDTSFRYEGRPVERPNNWGGFRIKPFKLEFWQGRADRLHDRLCYTLQTNAVWARERLMP